MRESRIYNALQFLNSINYRDYYAIDGVDIMTNLLEDVIKQAINLIPNTTVRMTNNDKQWIGPVVKNLIDKRWDAWRQRNWRLYEHQKTRCKIEVNRSKKRWADNERKSAKGMWKIVSEVKGKKETASMKKMIDEKGINEFIEKVTTNFAETYNYTDVNTLEMPECTDEQFCFGTAETGVQW